MPEDRFFERTRDALKYVCVISGDRVWITAEGIEVNGELLPHTAPMVKDSRGREMPALTLATTLRPGEYLVRSNDEDRGFDSRYYGILHQENLIARMERVIDW